MIRHLCLAIALALLASGAEARERLSLDAGWRFHDGDVPAAKGAVPGVAIGPWRWCVAPDGAADAAKMTAVDLDTSGKEWHVAQPGEDIFHGRVGFCWCRTTLPNVPAPRHVYFESIDDNGTLWLNGRQIAHHEGWSDPFDVSLDAAWKAGGPNVLAVLVENTAGPGSIGAATLAGSAPLPKDHPAAPGYHDADWPLVDVPHDFVVDHPFDPKADVNHGFHPGGIAWYRRTFDLPAWDRGHRLWVEFDGVYRNSRVWLNGRLLGVHASGYTSFYYDITDAAVIGGRNTLVVRADATSNEGWWYEGGGIYRHVWLVRLNPVHVAHWGTFVTSAVPDPGDGLTAPADVTARATVVNEGSNDAMASVHEELIDGRGKRVAQWAGESQPIPAGGHVDVQPVLHLPSAALWSLEQPALYRMVTEVSIGGRASDQVSTPFGIRTFRFDPDRGFLLNGKPVKINGTCNHQDFAGVGVALPDALQTYKIARLKEMGCNGYRCSHHPPSPELLEACDRLGMIVMDENRHLSSSEDNLADVRAMVLRDRNHPSVFLYSLCNEEGRQGTEEGERIARAMAGAIRELDPTRPITAAMNGGFGLGISNVVDVQGFNYFYGEFDPFHRKFPAKPCIGTESASITTTRGIYLSDPIRGYVSSLTNGAEQSWRPSGEREWMSGTYLWTGFDYRGEPTPYAWPSVTSHFGVMDLCGFPKDDYYYYQAWWTKEPVLHLFPHWNYAYPASRDARSQPQVEVRAYSNCERVELFVNGESQGVRDVPLHSHLAWKVRYAPGTLSAKGWRDGKVVAETTIFTAGAPAALVAAADRTQLRADGQDVAVIRVGVVDAAGHPVPTADNTVYFTAGPRARLLGVGNGDPCSLEPDHADHRRAFGGRCLLLVQSSDTPGPITVTCRAEGLKSATLTLNVAGP
jgi:beta-galactosidase